MAIEAEYFRAGLSQSVETHRVLLLDCDAAAHISE
jgi:hypothetical protein